MERRKYISLAFWAIERRQFLDTDTVGEPDEAPLSVVDLPDRPVLSIYTSPAPAADNGDSPFPLSGAA